MQRGILQIVSIIVTSISMLITASPKLVQTKGTAKKLFCSASRNVAGQPEGHAAEATGSWSTAASCSPGMKMLYQKVTVHSWIFILLNSCYLFCLLPVLIPDIAVLVASPELQETSPSSHVFTEIMFFRIIILFVQKLHSVSAEERVWNVRNL